MAKLTQEQKDQIIEQYKLGHGVKQIGDDLQIGNSIAIAGVIRGQQIRDGIVSPPNQKKKKNVTRTQTEKWVEEEDPIVEDKTPGQLLEETLINPPLFPRRPRGMIDHITVSRTVSYPRNMAALNGHLGNLDQFAEVETIKRAYGGGRYLVRAYNNRGELLAETPHEIPGRSLAFPVEAEEEGGIVVEAGASPELTEMSEMRKMLFALTEKQAQRERDDYEARLERERERAKEAMLQQQVFFNAQQQQQQAFFGQTMALLQASQRPAGPQQSIKETLETIALLKDMSGDSEGDPVTAAITALPKTLEAWAMIQGASQAPQSTMQYVPPQQPRPAQPSSPTPKTMVNPSMGPAQPRGDKDDDEDDGPTVAMTEEELAEEVYLTAMSKGKSQNEAVQLANGFLQMAKQVMSQPSQPANGNAQKAANE